MIQLNIHEAKTHLSKYLKRLTEGEVIILCKRNMPVAEIHPIRQPSRSPRPVGLAKGEFEVTERFFDPLPDEFVSTFNG